MSTQSLEQTEARDQLRAMLPPGTTLHTVLRHVSRSGMYRAIDVYLLGCDDGQPTQRWLSPLVARATGARFDKKHESIGIGGCGMDMGFAIVSDLSYALYPEGFACIGENCPANDHSNGDRDCTVGKPHGRGAGCYAIKHRWL